MLGSLWGPPVLLTGAVVAVVFVNSIDPTEARSSGSDADRKWRSGTATAGQRVGTCTSVKGERRERDPAPAPRRSDPEASSSLKRKRILRDHWNAFHGLWMNARERWAKDLSSKGKSLPERSHNQTGREGRKKIVIHKEKSDV